MSLPQGALSGHGHNAHDAKLNVIPGPVAPRCLATRSRNRDLGLAGPFAGAGRPAAPDAPRRAPGAHHEPARAHHLRGPSARCSTGSASCTESVSSIASVPPPTSALRPFHCWLTVFGAGAVGVDAPEPWSDDLLGVRAKVALTELWLSVRDHGEAVRAPSSGLAPAPLRRLLPRPSNQRARRVAGRGRADRRPR